MPQERYARLATTFDSEAALYERARPRYPERMFGDLAASLGRGSGVTRVLEIGAGTGQATRGLLARGWSVVALEPGPELAAVARRALAGLGEVQVVVAPFEQWQEGESFDLVFAATSWHWLDPAVAYHRAAQLLVPDGSLAVVTTAHVLPPDGDPFFREVESLYDEVGMGDGLGGPPLPEAVEPPDVRILRASGLFTEPVVHRYCWSQTYSAEDYLALLSTYSGHIAASAQQRARLFSGIQELIQGRPAATVTKHYLNFLQVARRAG